MALDFHPATSPQEASRVDRTAAFDEDTHALIAQYIDRDPCAFPLLGKIRDFYKDTVYAPNDLPALCQELRVLLGVANDTRVRMALERLHQALLEAQDNAQGMWVFCD